MAFIKLLPPESGESLSVSRVIELLDDEFELFESDSEAGRDHVGDMIAATLRFDDRLPGKQDRLNWLRTIQADAVMIAFSDGSGSVAQTCVMPDSELFFGSPDEVDGPARPLVERAARVLCYEVFEG